MEKKNLVIGVDGDDVVVEVCTERQESNPWYHVSRVGLVEAAKTLRQMAPVLIRIVQLISEWLQ